MSSAALLLLQVATSIAPTPAAKVDERLLHPVPPAHCDRSGADIVVCAKDPDAYRLKQIGPQFDTSGSLPNAEWRLFGDTKMSIHGTERALPGVGEAPAAMVTVTIPF